MARCSPVSGRIIDRTPGVVGVLVHASRPRGHRQAVRGGSSPQRVSIDFDSARRLLACTVRLSTLRGGNTDAGLLGKRIVESHSVGSLLYSWMGRSGGLKCKNPAENIVSGNWTNSRTRCRVEPRDGNPNWVPGPEFVAAPHSR